MARKTAIRTDNETERAADARMLERMDRAAERAAIKDRSGGLLPSLAQMRAARDMMTARELLALCRSASRLEMRGSNYSSEDRADCAAEIMRRWLVDLHGGMPRRTDDRYSLTVACGIARNLRDSLDRRRARDNADAEREAAERALQPSALGIESTPAAHAAIVARSSEYAACAAVDAVLSLLGASDDTDGGAGWLTLYQWVTGETAARVADRRGMSQKLAEKRIAAGARFLREFFSLAELADKLTLGARMLADGSLLFVLDDRSREAHGRTPAMAAPACGRKHWREGTDAGSRAERAQDAAGARTACTLRKLDRAERVHWTKQRARRADLAQETADSLTRAARAHARSTRRKASAAPTDSDLARSLVHLA